VPATAPGRPPVLLLHGTGGNEDDLVPLGQRVAPGAALISPRGKVTENGMPRFFRRLAEGVFDMDDLAARTDELAAFVTAAGSHYGLDKPIALGFSNGANVAWSLLLRHPESLAGAALVRAMLPAGPAPRPDLPGLPVLMLSGASDPMIDAAGRERLAAHLQAAGADLARHVLPAGHNLTAQDLRLLTDWFAQRT
jgi:phospholipase/carboxylesterase